MDDYRGVWAGCYLLIVYHMLFSNKVFENQRFPLLVFIAKLNRTYHGFRYVLFIFARFFIIKRSVNLCIHTALNNILEEKLPDQLKIFFIIKHFFTL